MLDDVSNAAILGAHLLLDCRCILDLSPRKMTAEQYNLLNNFSELAIRRLEEKHFPDLRVGPL